MAGETRTHGTPLRPGDPQRLGPYEVLRRLGEGGMGVVYLAADRDGRLVAVKLIRSDLADEPEFRRRFRSEVSRAQEVPPFCTAEVLDADPDSDLPYLVVEFVDGPSLSEVILDRGPLTPSNLHGLAIGVATALTAIHGAGVIHRDLKPSNVLLAPGSPKVIDFGIARAAESGDGETRTDQLIGTVAYMAPERLDPVRHQPLTSAADIFAWGAVVAFAATGRVPFLADSSPATAVAILTHEPDLAGVTEPLRAIVARALAKEPSDRPSARELLDELLSNAPRSAPRSAPKPRLPDGDDPHLTSGAAAAQVDLEKQPELAISAPMASEAPSIPRQTRVGDPEEAIATDVTPRPRPRSSLRRLGVAALIVAVVALGVTLAGIVRGDIRLPSNHAEGADIPSSSATPTSSPSAPANPFPDGRAFFDPLTNGANWTPADEASNFNSSCAIDSGLVASIGGNSSYRCPGYVTNVGDFKAAVDVTLLRAGSCASIWFHFTGQDGPQHGYALLVCESGLSLRTHTNAAANGGDLIATSDASSWSTVKLGVKTHIEFTVIGNYLTASRDGVTVLQQGVADYPYGRLILGIYQPKPRNAPAPSAPPDKFYSVRFTDLHLWSPASAGPPPSPQSQSPSPSASP